ncbi:hypothetical protein [Sphaerospermopsis torques-reginae]|uniref:Uncharacterized protein n=1 Tax=Sphaerospermopsis torques-reginae ITEP-024 TaxID=984208 RepID=A0ABX8WVU7_9CYAN|nr:hypothetical protein [Sphaerospermopsis torques-reginae]QYX30554.1 hypothetical protein K2F26_16880 [Sphaerospermopsis torques-reginae ITEP-024]
MRHLAPVALLAFLGTAAVIAIPKDFQATNTRQTLLAQQTPSPSTPKPDRTPTTPTPTPTPSPTPTPDMQ